jgi:hypothetical protein
MIRRLPRYAELRLQTLCAEAGALCHGVDEDESGWDCLIEFPEADFAGPPDARPPRAVAYAQVKSVTKRSLSCRVKLSNALRAAQSPQPWFVVLVTAGNNIQPPRVYAVHVWEELIRRTLEAARRSENGKRPLHKIWLPIRFRPSDEKEANLLKWMQAEIDAAGPEYEAAKRSINRTAGYEDGCGHAVMTIEAKSQEEIRDNFLGLGEGLRVNKFRFTPSRFGISSPAPQIDMSSGIIHITPNPAGEIEIRLRSPASSRTIDLPGHVYGGVIPGVPDEKKRLRFSAGFFELLWQPVGDSEFRTNLDGQDKHDLATIDDYCVLNELLAAGPIDLQIWSKGKRLIVGTLRHKDMQTDRVWKTLASALRLLRSIAGRHQVKVSLGDLFLSTGLKTFSDVADAGSLRIEFEPLSNTPSEPFTTMLYWCDVDVGDYAFCAVIERAVVEDIMIDGRRRVTAREHRCIDSYVLTKPSEADRKMMEADYQRHLSRLKETGSPLDLANLREFIAACAERNPPAPAESRQLE